jgi:plasmid segregation protein ParM
MMANAYYKLISDFARKSQKAKYKEEEKFVKTK